MSKLLDELRDELTNDPKGIGYSADNAAAADQLNSKTRPGKAPAGEVLSFVQENFDDSGRVIVGTVELIANGSFTDWPDPMPTHPITLSAWTQEAARTACIGMLRRFTHEPEVPVDIDKAALFASLLQGLGAMTATQLVTFVALKDNRQSRVQELCIADKVYWHTVEKARS